MADGFDKRLLRPTDAAPSKNEPLSEREAWAQRFVPWFFAQTGGEWPEPPEGGVAGRRWRAEYPDCVANPQAFEQYAEQEVKAYQARGGA